MILNIPPGLNLDEFYLIIIVEFIFLIGILILFIIAVKKYLNKKSTLRLYVLLFVAVNLVMFMEMVALKIMILYNIIPEYTDLLGFSRIMFVFTLIICWYIYSEVFINNEKKNSNSRLIFVLISLVPFGIYIFVQTGIGEMIYFIIIFAQALIVFLGMMISSLKVAKKLPEKIDKISMRLIFGTGLSIMFTLCLSLIDQILRMENIISSSMEGLYLLYMVTGLIPIFLFYLAFFRPEWFVRRYSAPTLLKPTPLDSEAKKDA